MHALTLHTVHLVHVDAALGLEDLNDQCKTHGNFCRSDSDHEEHEDLSAEALEHTAECNHRQVGSIQHQLNGHEDDERVAADQNTQRANREQDCRKNDVIMNWKAIGCEKLFFILKSL